jgi:hypothetical protein
MAKKLNVPFRLVLFVPLTLLLKESFAIRTPRIWPLVFFNGFVREPLLIGL